MWKVIRTSWNLIENLVPLGDMKKLLGLLKRKKYDVIHINPSMMTIPLLRDYSLLGICLLFSYHKRMLIFFHGWEQAIAVKISTIPILKNTFLKFTAICGKVVVLSKTFKNTLVDMGMADNIVTVTTTMFEQPKPKSKILKDDDIVTILFLARFVREKGLYSAGRIAKIIHDSGIKNIRFIFAGDGPEMSKFKKYIKDSNLNGICKLPGYLRGEKKVKVLENSHILLLPTYYPEGCPVVILEAMGAGAVILSTFAGGISEVVENGINGYLFREIDEHKITEKIIELVTEKNILRRIGERNLKVAENVYEAKIVSQKITSLYRTLAGE